MTANRTHAMGVLFLGAAFVLLAGALVARAEEAQPQSPVAVDVTFRLKQAAEVLEQSGDPEDREIAQWLREKNTVKHPK